MPDADSTGLLYWRNDLFAASVLYLIPLGLIPLSIGVYVAYITDLYLLMAVDLLAVICFIIIAYTPRIRIFYRKVIFCVVLYAVSLALLYSLGSYGPGLLYLLGVTFFAVLIFDEMVALISVYVNVVVCVLFGVMIHYELGGGVITQEYDLASWFAVSSNLVLLCAVAVLLIPRLFKGLESAFEKRSQLENQIMQNHKSLEDSLKKLEEKNKELEKFAYIASHDLKEPLRMIRNFVELLSKKYGGELDEKAQQYIRFAVDGANRMTLLIDELLEYSRVGRIHNEQESVNLNQLLDEIVKDFPTSSKIRISIDPLPEVKAVPVSMKLLFRNLISNGLKYQSGESKPKIDVSVKDEGEFWKFAVKDNGIGIDKDDYDVIFQLFKRLHGSNEYSGSGMGLAICKKIVEQHGGTIWVESEPGSGSVFSFTIKK